MDNVRLLIKEASLQMNISLTVNVSANLLGLYTIKTLSVIVNCVQAGRAAAMPGLAFI